MSERAPAWVVPLMRAGYGARGIVYVVIGFLVIGAAWSGGASEGTQGALATLASESWGTALLWVIAFGLAAYCVWRLTDSLMDLEDYGTDAKGLIARGGMIVTGLIHLGLAISAARYAMSGGGGSGGEGGKVQSWTAALMSEPFGKWLVIVAGLATIGAGIYYARKGWKEKYKSHLKRTETTERLAPACKFGLIAHGAVIAIIGFFLAWAGWTADPSQAGGLGAAFETVRGAAFGRILLFLTGIGMLGFAIYCFIEAGYRIVPARAGDDVKTLAKKAKAKVEAQTA